jgi:hypothetical protein
MMYICILAGVLTLALVVGLSALALFESQPEAAPGGGSAEPAEGVDAGPAGAPQQQAEGPQEE